MSNNWAILISKALLNILKEVAPVYTYYSIDEHFKTPFIVLDITELDPINPILTAKTMITVRIYSSYKGNLELLTLGYKAMTKMLSRVMQIENTETPATATLQMKLITKESNKNSDIYKLRALLKILN